MGSPGGTDLLYLLSNEWMHFSLVQHAKLGQEIRRAGKGRNFDVSCLQNGRLFLERFSYALPPPPSPP